jgi:NitT/TauT family transport system substrate-binding protein
MMGHVRLWRGALIGLVALGVAGLAPGPRPGDVAAQPAAEPAAELVAEGALVPEPQLTVVRFGSPQAISDAGIFVGRDRGYFRELGFDVQTVPFQSAPMTIAPLASGDLELAGGAFSTGLLNAVDRGIVIKAVADKGTSRQGFEFSQNPIRPELISSGAVRSIADLRGRRLAVASLRSGAESAIAQMLAMGGLTIADVDLIELGYGDMVTAMANGILDGGNIIEPTLTAAYGRGVAQFWEDGRTSVAYGGVYQAGTLYASERILQGDQLARLMVGYLRGVRDYNDAFAKNQGRADLVRILTENTALRDPALYEQMNMPGLDPDGRITTVSLQRDLDYFRAQGYYTGPQTVERVVDASYAERAAAQLGPYAR